jgi:hypothetical protein
LVSSFFVTEAKDIPLTSYIYSQHHHLGRLSLAA